MSKLQCFRITRDGELYYIVAHYGLELFFGFKLQPKKEIFQWPVSDFFVPYVDNEINHAVNVLATNPEKVWEFEIKDSPMYEQDDGELTAQQINAIRHASSATNTPEENFGDSLFTRED